MPTTVFDASLITQRARDKAIAQQVQQANRAGQPIIVPQAGYGSYLCGEYANGAITYFRKMGGCTDINLACSCEAAASATTSNVVPVANPRYTITINVLPDELNVSIGITGSGTIYWGDGSSQAFNTNGENLEFIHEYSNDGTYDIVIATFITALCVSNASDDMNQVGYIGQKGGTGFAFLQYPPNVTKIILENASGLEALIANNETLTEIVGLSNCNNLKEIQLNNNSLGFDTILAVTNLDILYFNNKPQITDVFNVTNKFPLGLTELSLGNNSTLTSVIGLSSLVNLESFSAGGSYMLTSADLSNNPGITVANFNNTSINTLPNVNNNLTGLGIQSTLITGDIDLTQYKKLDALNVSQIGISSLNISGLSSLVYLDCYETGISSLNLTGLSSLETLQCYQTGISSLNLSNLTELIEVNCSNTPLRTLNFSGVYNNYIDEINCSNTQLSSLNLIGVTDIQILNCSQTGISSLNLTGLTYIGILDCSQTQLSSLNLTGLTYIGILDCSQTPLSSLNVAGLTSLELLNCNQTGISSLDLSGLTNLYDLNCSQTGINSLDLSGLTELTELDCSLTGISSLDVSGLTNLSLLSCFETGISSLDLSGLTNLQLLNCSQTGISSLDLSGLNNLYELNCYNCNLNPSSISTIGNQLIPSNAGSLNISTASQQTPFTIVSTIAPWTTLMDAGWSITY
jgi:hypothetical protein